MSYPKGPYATAIRLKDDGCLNDWTERDGDYWEWSGRAYERRTDKNLRNYLGYLLNDRAMTVIDWEPNKAKLTNVIDALVLDPVEDPPGAVLSLENGLFDPATVTLSRPSRGVFITNHLPYAFEAEAACPAWDEFLRSLWPDDAEATALLQEWFGYLVSGSTARQKALLMIGPKRSGKGTIMRVAEALVGSENTGALRMNNLKSWFGLQSVVGKSLAVIGDLRIDGRLPAEALETLLSVTGEDKVNIQRKGTGNEPIDVRLKCRIMAGTNIAPIFADPGGALPTRFLYLPMTRSFYGEEDTELGDCLAAELPGILNWSLLGWRRLMERGRFTEPASARALLADAERDASPVGEWLVTECMKDPDEFVPSEYLYDGWCAWASRRGYKKGDLAGLVNTVRATWPDLENKQRRVDGRVLRGLVGLRFMSESERQAGGAAPLKVA